MVDLVDINSRIADRSNVFYWQTDRRVTPEEAGEIWADRSRGFSDKMLIEGVNKELKDDKLRFLDNYDPKSQTNLGNISYSRTGKLESGKEIVVRSFPIGIKNGYFDVESAASEIAIKANLPSYHTYLIHHADKKDEFSFQLCEKLPGTAVVRWLEKNPKDEDHLLLEIGKMLAKVNSIPVERFGPFDNEIAKKGRLVGLHKTYASAMLANIDENLKTLIDEGILDQNQSRKSQELFMESNSLLKCDNPILIHNDFADWNLLTDGKKITGILDWDECVGGDFISEIACWSTFFEPERLEGMLKGYWTVTQKPDDFEERFQLLRYRYTISKMSLRIRRYSWEPTEAIRKKIEVGKLHLAASIKHFDID